MSNGPVTDVKSGRGFATLFDQLTCFIRTRMFITQFLGLVPVRPFVEHDVAGSAKQRAEMKRIDE